LACVSLELAVNLASPEAIFCPVKSVSLFAVTSASPFTIFLPDTLSIEETAFISAVPCFIAFPSVSILVSPSKRISALATFLLVVPNLVVLSSAISVCAIFPPSALNSLSAVKLISALATFLPSV
jgi:hypothetical protein